MGVQIDAVTIFLGGAGWVKGRDSDSLNIYERDFVSKKEELSRDKVAEWQEVVAKQAPAPPPSAIPNLSDLESRGNSPFFFISVFFFGVGSLFLSGGTSRRTFLSSKCSKSLPSSVVSPSASALSLG